MSDASLPVEKVLTMLAAAPPRIAALTDYLEQEFPSALQAFTAQRTDLLAVLEPLTPESWSRSATVIGAGKALERTVLFYARWLASHERPHLKQIARIVSMIRM